jgi:hypothetical protein
MFMSRITELQVNGKGRRVDGERSLLSRLQDDLELIWKKLFGRAAAADCNRRRLW